MKKINFIFFSLVFIFFSASAQTDQLSPATVPVTRIDIGFEGAGISFQRKLSGPFMIELSTGIGGGYDEVNKNTISYSWDLFNPGWYLSVAPKFLYNFRNRMKAGKNTKFNSADFIGAKVKWGMTNLLSTEDPVTTVATNIHWGMQRNLGNRWLFTGQTGIGYIVDISSTPDPSGTIYPALDIKFSYVLSGRKKKS